MIKQFLLRLSVRLQILHHQIIWHQTKKLQTTLQHPLLCILHHTNIINFLLLLKIYLDKLRLSILYCHINGMLYNLNLNLNLIIVIVIISSTGTCHVLL